MILNDGYVEMCLIKDIVVYICSIFGLLSYFLMRKWYVKFVYKINLIKKDICYFVFY